MFKKGDKLQVGGKGKVFTVVEDEDSANLVYCVCTNMSGQVERKRFNTKRYFLILCNENER